MKQYTLDHFGGNRFALVNKTDADPLTDYFPGVWGIETQKTALSYCREILNEGNEVTAGMGDQKKISRILKRI